MFNPGNYFVPGYGMPYRFMAPSGGLGLFRNLGRSMGFFRNINWGSLLNNTSRALGVVNQAIPIVKQAGPMFSNMRSMLRLASAFKDITDEDRVNIKKDTSNTSNFSNINSNNYNNINSMDNGYQDNYIPNNNNNNNNIPNFFI